MSPNERGLYVQQPNHELRVVEGRTTRADGARASVDRRSGRRDSRRASPGTLNAAFGFAPAPRDGRSGATLTAAGGPAGYTLLHAAGDHLGRFDILASLGAGSMGEVYRARDRRLGRDVAIKVVPEAMAEDAERLARFEREARFLASLNHPNIASVYGLEEEDGRRFLVMELVEGGSLAERIATGAIPIADALPIALQIADGLGAAHDHGVVHRDLKPANVMITPGGRVKLLDFGLATAHGAADADRDDDLARSPTLTDRITAPGGLLGTVAYMSPEQARGGRVDARADIWAFGCVLWEMLSGRPPFEGQGPGDVLAAVLRDDPDWEHLPEALPEAVRRLLRRCLCRDPGGRLHHMGDARIELLEAAEDSRRGPSAVPDGDRPAAPASVRPWPLTTDVCRHLNRATLDPAIIGDELSVLDNNRSSDVVVVYVPGFGFDHDIFREVLARSPYRGIAVTPYGFEPGRRRRPPLHIADHLTILRLFLESVIRDSRPRTAVLTGFSVGADIVMRLCSRGGVDHRHVDGVLALGPNVSLQTCFVTSRLAAIPDDSEVAFLEVVQEVAALMQTPQAWLQMNSYLVELVRKYHADFGALRSYARDVIAPFLEAGESPFAGWYRATKEAGIEVRAVFAGADVSEQIGLREIRLAQVDRQVLGPRFRDADIVSEPDAHHMGLMDAEVIERHLDQLLHRLRESSTSAP